jgi:hypothetical protein
MLRNIPILTEPRVEGIDGGVALGLVATGESDLDLQISYLSSTHRTALSSKLMT